MVGGRLLCCLILFSSLMTMLERAQINGQLLCVREGSPWTLSHIAQELKTLMNLTTVYRKSRRHRWTTIHRSKHSISRIHRLTAACISHLSTQDGWWWWCRCLGAAVSLCHSTSLPCWAATSTSTSQAHDAGLHQTQNNSHDPSTIASHLIFILVLYRYLIYVAYVDNFF